MGTKRVFVATDLNSEQHRHERMAVFLAEELGCDLEVFYTETGLEKTIMHLAELESSDDTKVQTMPTSVSQVLHQELQNRFSAYKKQCPDKLHTTVRFGNKGPLTELEVQNNADNIECVVLGRKSRNIISNFFSGTLTQKLCGKVKVPVLVVPEDSKVFGFQKILYATALEEETPSYEGKIKDFAKKLKANIQLIHVSELETDSSSMLERFSLYPKLQTLNVEILRKEIEDKCKKDLLRYSESFGVTPDTPPILANGNAADEILSHVEKSKPDLLVLGNHRRGALAKLFLGSVGQKLISNAPCPVMVFPNDSSSAS